MRLLTAYISLLLFASCEISTQDPPEFIERPRDQRVVSSEAAAFFCRARGDPPPDIKWLHNGEPLQASVTVKVAGGQGFWLEPVRKTTDEGEYQCVAENKVGDPERASATLTVIAGDERPDGFPTIEQHPSLLVAERNRNFRVPCTALGTPTPVIRWYRDGVPINMSDPRFVLLSAPYEGYLQVEKPSKQDKGKYRCSAENEHGIVFSKDATVYVKLRRVPPSFTIPPQLVYEVKPGDDLNISCVASGSPVPYIRWRKEPDVQLTPSDNVRTGRDFLVLTDIQQSGNYTCEASSELHTITTTTLIKVQAKPSPPTGLRVSDVKAQSVRLSWDYDQNKIDTIEYYVIQYGRVKVPLYMFQSEVDGVNSLHYVVGNLAASTEYKFRVIAVSNIGRGDPSEPLQVTTALPEPGTAPEITTVRPLSSSTLVVKWNAPERFNGKIVRYKVYYVIDASLPLRHWKSETVNSGDNTLTTISNLQPHTIYTFRVEAQSIVGSSPPSLPVRAKTQQGVPSQPNGLTVKRAGSTSADLIWKRPSYSGNNIVHYTVYLNDSYSKEVKSYKTPLREQYEVGDLYPNTKYYVWVSASSSMGEGADTPPVSFHTEEYVPGGPPLNVSVQALDSRSILVTWLPPARQLRHGRIHYYKLFYKQAPHHRHHHHHHEKKQQARSPSSVRANRTSGSEPVTEVKITDPSVRNFTVDELRRYTEYQVWLLAGTSVGDGPPSLPVTGRTDEDVPGKPRALSATVINSTTVQVEWQPPPPHLRHGRIVGYHVYVFELNSEGNERLSGSRQYELRNAEANSYNISDLQPSTTYLFRVAALTRKGDGSRSEAARAATPGGVPNRPKVLVEVVREGDQAVVVDVKWQRPTEIYGELVGYRIRYGRITDPTYRQIIIKDIDVQQRRLDDLERGVQYEFRVCGRNQVGFGQEEVVHYKTSEGAPTGSPTNVSFRFQTSNRVAFTWDPPLERQRNGRVSGYTVRFQRMDHVDHVQTRDTNFTKVVFDKLEDDALYSVSVRANTSVGAGPWSQPALQLRTDRDLVRPPINLRAMATSQFSVEVWWDQVHTAAQIIGYQVFYSMSDEVDLDVWAFKAVPITTSAELDNLDKHAHYNIMVAARSKTGLGRLSDAITVRVKPIDVPSNLRARDVTTHSMSLSWGPPVQLNPRSYRISYDAVKEFLDAAGVTQTQRFGVRTAVLDPGRCDFAAASADSACSHVIGELAPFTTYTVNVTAVPYDNEYRPPARLRVTTQMAAPQPLVKPGALGVRNEREVVLILPRASEEFGPISHYYIVVVPQDPTNPAKHPDFYRTNSLVDNRMTKLVPDYSPYIAAKFYQRDIPYTFALGDNQIYDHFRNKPLELELKYRMFVRAIVDTPGKHLYTSSPYSDVLGLDMRRLDPSEPLPQRPGPGQPVDRKEIPRDPDAASSPLVWLLGPLLGGLVLIVALIVYAVMAVHRRRIGQKSAVSSGAMMKPLMCDSAGATVPLTTTGLPCDPVEARRLNFQTPAIASHPPIHVSQLSQQLDTLRAEDNRLFSQEYESIETGQQFTWVHSNMDCNKGKNRYANVIAYDHSRVVLQPLDGVPGSDYINANYCDGYRKRNAYIATQGPLPDTIADFWRMVWEQHSCTVVMMTRLEERARIKCDQYWPSRDSQLYGQISVTLLDVQQLASYTVRTFQLHRTGSAECREVQQLQFTAWPDHGVPDHPTPFLMFLRRVRALNPPKAGPIVTHCSAGVGRTGCFIVIDSMLERIRAESSVDVYAHVTCLRSQRNYMVQTEDQYMFIHDALMEAVSAGDTEVPNHCLESYVAQLLQPVGPPDNCTGMELQFKKLSSMKVQPFRFVSAHVPVNKAKNRFVNILPFESTRVCLQPLRGVDGSDYINANFVDGYWARDAYIATQAPLAETTADLWRMLWEHNSTIVVMLTKLSEMGREKCHQYWPSAKAARYEYCVVEPISEFNMNNCTMREFKVTDARDGSLRTVRQFQFTDWPEQGVPKFGDSFIDFIGHVHKAKAQFGLEGPITVHCSAGVGRTGAFIALSMALERAQVEGVVDIFNTVRVLRNQRPAMVQTEDQYQFVYRVALEYLVSLDQLDS